MRRKTCEKSLLPSNSARLYSLDYGGRTVMVKKCKRCEKMRLLTGKAIVAGLFTILFINRFLTWLYQHVGKLFEADNARQNQTKADAYMPTGIRVMQEKSPI